MLLAALPVDDERAEGMRLVPEALRGEDDA